MNKAIFHCVLHIAAVGLVLVQMLAIKELREDYAEARVDLHKAAELVATAAQQCMDTHPALSKEQ